MRRPRRLSPHEQQRSWSPDESCRYVWRRTTSCRIQRLRELARIGKRGCQWTRIQEESGFGERPRGTLWRERREAISDVAERGCKRRQQKMGWRMGRCCREITWIVWLIVSRITTHQKDPFREAKLYHTPQFQCPNPCESSPYSREWWLKEFCCISDSCSLVVKKINVPYRALSLYLSRSSESFIPRKRRVALRRELKFCTLSLSFNEDSSESSLN